MKITLKSEIEKHAIRLPEWIRIPDGTKVKVWGRATFTKMPKA